MIIQNNVAFVKVGVVDKRRTKMAVAAINDERDSRFRAAEYRFRRIPHMTVDGPVVWNGMSRNKLSTDISLASVRNRLRVFLFDADTQ